jgi:hypothetical protein
MSSDYRPRGASNSGSGSGNGGGRRRRGGRGRGGAGRSSHSGEHRSHSNGTSANGTHAGGPKKKGPIAAFFSWITGGDKKKPATSSGTRSIHPTESRAREQERNEPRPERTDRPERAERGERSERPPRAERPPREERPEPEPQEIVTPKLYVGNLAYEASESDLFDLFSKVGSVKNVEIAMDRRSNRSKGFGFVEMEVIETAKEAAEKLNRTDFMGRQIVVSGAKMERHSVNPSEEPSQDESNSSASSSEESSSI